MESQILPITVTLFASIREAAGISRLALELPGGSTLREVRTELVRRYPFLSGQETSLAWAVNHAYAKLDHPLSAGDEVAVLPPVSGGSCPAPPARKDPRRG